MSGGSFGYSFREVESMARFLLKCPQPYRKAFGRHLLDVAEAMHDVEYVESGDMSTGDEKEAIMKCITNRDVCDALLIDAQMMVDELQAWILEAKG